MVLEEGFTMDLEDYRKGYYYPKGTRKHNQHEVSRVNFGLKNPGVEYQLTKWHHEMLSRIMVRIITLGIQIIARLLSGPLRCLGS